MLIGVSPYYHDNEDCQDCKTLRKLPKVNERENESKND